ncbi:MAG: HIT domain-containing protein, partial [Bacteroidales bacterium]|nr:HIT domain-containing protein [Bacteroidales bacterium]
MASIFSRIVAGEIPCYKIAEDDRFFAFLDISPMKRGHTLVIPKEEKDYLFDYDDETVGDILVFAKKVAAAIRKAVPCQRIAMMV